MTATTLGYQSTAPRPVRFIGDIHGESAAFSDAIAGAQPSGAFIVQLGDLIDFGPDSPGCFRLMRRLMERQAGLFVRSNHDDKLYRYHSNRPPKVSLNLQETLAQFAAADDGSELIDWFLDTYARIPYWLRLGDHFCVHGAFHPDMLTYTKPEDSERKRTQSKLRALALYGETTGALDEDGYPVRTYGWVDSIPAELTVVVGHDIRSREAPMEVSGALGGRALFLDTGSGKDGRLSVYDVVLSDHQN